jgi:hypothetical protein
MPRQDGKPVAMRIDSIICDARLQVRQHGLDDDHIDNLTETIKTKGAKKPPRVKVRQITDPPGYKPGVYSFTIDGNHTLKAYSAAGKKVVPAQLKKSTWEDALTEAALSNQGPRALPLRRSDKARAVKMLLDAHGDDTDDPWSDGMIAKQLGISPTTVANHRPVPKVGSQSKRTGADGRAYQKARREKEETPKDRAEARAKPLTEPSLELTDYELAACKTRDLSTAGDLYDYIHAGGNLWMKSTRLYNVKTALLELGVGPSEDNKRVTVKDTAPSKNGDPSFNWRAFDEAYGVIAKAPDQLAKLHPDAAAECSALTDSLTEFRATWERLRNKVTTPEEATKL